MHKVYKFSFASIYPLYVAKVVKKGRTKQDVDEVLKWLSGYSQSDIEKLVASDIDLETYVTKYPSPNPKRMLIRGLICGVRIENIEDPIMREIRFMDKLVDDLAKGKSLDKILYR